MPLICPPSVQKQKMLCFKNTYQPTIFNEKPTRKHAIRIANALKSSQVAIRSPSYDLGGPKKLPWGPFKGTMGAPSHGQVEFSMGAHSCFFRKMNFLKNACKTFIFDDNPHKQHAHGSIKSFKIIPIGNQELEK